MGSFELGTDDRRLGVDPRANLMLAAAAEAEAAARGDTSTLFASRAARLPTPVGSSSVQVQRRLSAVTNRTTGLGDDQLGSFLSKALKGAGNALKRAAKPIVRVAAAAGVPGAGAVNELLPGAKPKAKAIPKKPTRIKPTAAPVKLAPDASMPANAPDIPIMLTAPEASLQSKIAGAKKGLTTAKQAHDLAQKAKDQSKTLADRARRLASNATSASQKAAAAASAGDSVGAGKFAELARQIQAVAANTASAATTAADYSERGGNAIAAGTDAALAAAATNSEEAGGFVAMIQRNPIPFALGATVLAFVGYKAIAGGKRRAA